MTSVVIVKDDLVFKFKRDLESLNREWANVERARSQIDNVAWHLPGGKLVMTSGLPHIEMPNYQRPRLAASQDELFRIFTLGMRNNVTLEACGIESSREYSLCLRLLEECLSPLDADLGGHLREILDEVVGHAELTVGIRHGDFRTPNIREYQGTLILIDFEDFAINGISEFDLVDLWLERTQLSRNCFWIDCLNTALQSQRERIQLFENHWMSRKTLTFYLMSRVASDMYSHSIAYSHSYIGRSLHRLLEQ